MAMTSGISTPAHHESLPLGTLMLGSSYSKSLRSYALAVMAFGLGHKFQTRISAHHKRTMGEVLKKERGFDTPLNVC